MPILPDIRCTGVILAAGRGRRMGRTKQLVEWPTATGSKPLVAAAYDSIRPICDGMVVVLGHEADAVAAAIGDRPFRRAICDPDAPMFESIRAGLAVATTEFDPFATIVLQPGDHPEVSLETLKVLKQHSRPRMRKYAGSDLSHSLPNWPHLPDPAIIPEHDGRGGHPVFIPADIARMILKADCPDGLGQFWAEHPELCERLPVDDSAIVRDVDTPGDLPA